MSGNKITQLIGSDTVGGVSQTFELEEQATIYAAGLTASDTVTIEMVLVSGAVPQEPCGCPPGAVVLPGVIDAMTLLCCGVPITLSRTRPYVVVDAPLNQKLRVRLNQVNPNAQIDTQRVWMRSTQTLNVNDRLRGCPCGSDQ